MRKTTSFLLGIISILLYSCSGSETYRGLWKATDSNGEKLEITFDAKKFSIKDSTGKASNFEYTQNSVSIENSVETYGIQLSDGRGYFINFPFADDESKGIIKDAGGNPVYTIGRGAYLKYEDIYKLK
jgi:hypothetical protein